MTVEYLVGTGGWAYYYEAPRSERLNTYSKHFPVVEVNSTFYELPNPQAVKRWRRQVNNSFIFIVKCHRSVTHDHPFQLTEDNQKVMERMEEICEKLRAPLLVLQTPPSLTPTKETLERASTFLSSYPNIRFAWEPRGPAWSTTQAKKAIASICTNTGTVHVTDLSKGHPAAISDILYTRLFGPGASYYSRHQFTDEELRQIYAAVQKSGAKRAYLIFHNPRMYQDASRFQLLLKTGTLPPVTEQVDGAAALEVLGRRALSSFPLTRSQLIRRHGWKLIHTSSGTQVALASLLKRSSKQRFESPQELADEVNQLLKVESQSA